MANEPATTSTEEPRCMLCRRRKLAEDKDLDPKRFVVPRFVSMGEGRYLCNYCVRDAAELFAADTPPPSPRVPEAVDPQAFRQILQDLQCAAMALGHSQIVGLGSADPHQLGKVERHIKRAEEAFASARAAGAAEMRERVAQRIEQYDYPLPIAVFKESGRVQREALIVAIVADIRALGPAGPTEAGET